MKLLFTLLLLVASSELQAADPILYQPAPYGCYTYVQGHPYYAYVQNGILYPINVPYPPACLLSGKTYPGTYGWCKPLCKPIL